MAGVDPMLWALKAAPVKDPCERLVLTFLGEAADADGCNAFPSQKNIAKGALCDARTVRNKLTAMEARGLIRRGDQAIVAQRCPQIPPELRPVNWDVLVPFSYFRDIDEINENRRVVGLPPLTAESRPNHSPAPKRAPRKDAGKKRKPKAEADPEGGAGAAEPPESDSGGRTAGGRNESPDPPESDSAPPQESDSDNHPLKTNHPHNQPNSSVDPAVGEVPVVGGAAAARPTAAGRTTRSPRSGPMRQATADVGRVIAALPPQLTEDFGDLVPERITDRIRHALTTRTADQLRDRIDRRWVRGLMAAVDSGRFDPVAVASALIRPGACPDVRCEDGQVDIGDDQAKTCGACTGWQPPATTGDAPDTIDEGPRTPGPVCHGDDDGLGGCTVCPLPFSNARHTPAAARRAS